MLFVTGGAYQGKSEYVRKRFGLNDEEIYTCNEDEMPDFSKRCINHYEKYILFAMRNNENPRTDFNDDQIIVMDDMNCGVVPVDEEIRAYRESVGRTGCALARNATEVVRLFCGIPKTIRSRKFKIWMVRHGKTRATEEHKYCGITDIPLSEDGIKELRELKKKDIYPDIAGKILCTSGLLRAVQTAEILFPGVEIIKDNSYNEMNFGRFEMRKYEGDLQNDADFLVWANINNETNICPEGESSLIMKQRVYKAFEKLIVRGTDSVIVCHGGPIEAVLERYNPDSGLNYYEIEPGHGKGYCLEFEGDRLIDFRKIE